MPIRLHLRTGCVQPESIPASSIPLPVLLLDQKGRVLSANVQAQEYLGMSVSRLAGMPLAALFEAASGVERLIERVAGSNREISDHRLYLSSSENPCSVHIGSGAEGITAVLVPEANRTELEQQLKRQEMAEAVARIALEMAHEVKNPLAALKGAAQWLSEQPQSAEGAQEAMHMILAEAARIHARIDAFLQLGPRASVEMAPTNIHSLLNDVCKPPASVHLRKVFDPSLPEMMVHPGRLRQAIENLWRNALEAGAAHIEIQTRVAPMVRLPEHGGPVMEVRIINDGEPIPARLMEGLFEPFVTGKQRGSGLGLAIVQRVMYEHHGRVHVNSERGRTVFTLYLPTREDA